VRQSNNVVPLFLVSCRQVLDNFDIDGSGSVESVELSDVNLSDVSAPETTSSPSLSARKTSAYSKSFMLLHASTVKYRT
jgi:hypothetical protein